jgi:hypothetical protein
LINKPASGQAAAIYGQTNGVSRWSLSMGDGTAETGVNVGSNLDFYAYSDAGAYISTPLALIRADVSNPVQILVSGLYRQVLCQAANSAGSGFRLLCVAN